MKSNWVRRSEIVVMVPGLLRIWICIPQLRAPYTFVVCYYIPYFRCTLSCPGDDYGQHAYCDRGDIGS